MTQRMQQRRDSAANWTSVNPVLASGEIGIETGASPRRFKIGDGSTAWNSLPYAVTPPFVVSQTDFTETYRYYGGLIGSDWKINRYSTTTFVKTSATIANNPSRANLSAAWTNRLTLTYA